MDNIIDKVVDIKSSSFPNDFIWGVATSAFQIEGASNIDGRGQSIWDTFCNKTGTIADNSNGDIACDHYHKYEEDLDLISNLGVNAYRFSISWPRVQPQGFGLMNKLGIGFYDRLIDGMLARNLKPYLTLYHWDLPQALQDIGGWNNRDVCSHFSEYAAKICYHFGDRLESITTHNEPWVTAILGHENGIFAPGIKSRKIAYQAAHHLLLSHGMALEAMRNISNKKIPMGIVLNQSPFYPLENNQDDIEKANLEYSLLVRWYMDPLLKGLYPADVMNYLGDDKPELLTGDLKIINTNLDFIGINYYTRQLISSKGHYDPKTNNLPVTDMGWEIFPHGLTELLIKLNTEYTLPPIYITENGAAFRDEFNVKEITDNQRIEYIKDHITAVHNAIQRGVNVKGYFVWSLLDNFEWASGYEKRFGIIYVDYKTLQRKPKQSAYWYRNFINRK